MRPMPLQLWDPEVPPDWVLVYGQATDVLSAVIGLFIAYLAYRGYRRNASRPMLYISAGFVLALAVPFLLLVVYLLLPTVPQPVVAVATQTSQVAGLLAILYALWMPA